MDNNANPKILIASRFWIVCVGHIVNLEYRLERDRLA
jgi:hypothetical protein